MQRRSQKSQRNWAAPHLAHAMARAQSQPRMLQIASGNYLADLKQNRRYLSELAQLLRSPPASLAVPIAGTSRAGQVPRGTRRDGDLVCSSFSPSASEILLGIF